MWNGKGVIYRGWDGRSEDTIRARRIRRLVVIRLTIILCGHQIRIFRYRPAIAK